MTAYADIVKILDRGGPERKAEENEQLVVSFEKIVFYSWLSSIDLHGIAHVLVFSGVLSLLIQ